MSRRYLVLVAVLVVGVGADQVTKAWADARLATDEHPQIVEVEPDDEGKTVAQLMVDRQDVDPERLEALMADGYRPLMRFDSRHRASKDAPAFAPSQATGQRGLSYWIFHREDPSRPPIRLPRASQIAEDTAEFASATVGEYVTAKLGVALGEARLARVLEKHVYAVDYTRVLPSDLVEAGETFLLLDRVVTLVPGFGQLRYAENPGAAWGVLGSWSPQVRRTFFQVVSVFALAVLAALFHRLRDEQTLPIWALALVFSGAIGNFIDRLRFNHVIDFIDFWAHGTHFPTFNIADVLISCGALLLAGEAMVRRDRSYLLGARGGSHARLSTASSAPATE